MHQSSIQGVRSCTDMVCLEHFVEVMKMRMKTPSYVPMYHLLRKVKRWRSSHCQQTTLNSFEEETGGPFRPFSFYNVSGSGPTECAHSFALQPRFGRLGTSSAQKNPILAVDPGGRSRYCNPQHFSKLTRNKRVRYRVQNAWQK